MAMVLAVVVVVVVIIMMMSTTIIVMTTMMMTNTASNSRPTYTAQKGDPKEGDDFECLQPVDQSFLSSAVYDDGTDAEGTTSVAVRAV